MPENRDLLYDSMIAYFIPFRSPDIKSLHARKESFGFAKNLWTQILINRETRLIICLGNEVRDYLMGIYRTNYKRFNFKVGWGNIGAEIDFLDSGPKILKLPHLSRFRIFNREESKQYIDDLISTLTKDL